jgi:hypothetical protein
VEEESEKQIPTNVSNVLNYNIYCPRPQPVPVSTVPTILTALEEISSDLARTIGDWMAGRKKLSDVSMMKLVSVTRSTVQTQPASFKTVVRNTIVPSVTLVSVAKSTKVISVPHVPMVMLNPIKSIVSLVLTILGTMDSSWSS